MTQLIDFETLKNAFANKDTATVTSFDGASIQTPKSDANAQRIEELDAKNNQLSKLAKQQKEQLGSIEAAYQRALRQLNALNQDQKDVDTDLQRLHEDKIRLVRSLKIKQNETIVVKKEINQLQSVERALRIKLSHSKHSIKKLQQNTEQQQAAIKNKDQHILQLKREIEQLKQTKSLKNIIKEHYQVYSEQALELAEHYWQQIKDRKNKQKIDKENIRWTAVTANLPKKQCMVYVRNSQHSDVAIFNPCTGKFKCANTQLKVKQWAFAQ